MRKFFNFITSRFFFISIILFVQILLIALFAATLIPKEYGVYILIGFFVVNSISIIAIVNSKANEEIKIAWIVCIALVPTGGVLLYLLFANKRTTKRQKNKLEPMLSTVKRFQTPNLLTDELKYTDIDAYSQAKFIKTRGNFEIYKDTEVTYFSLGEKAWPHILEDLKKAKHYIFIEFYIIEEGEFFNSILDILIKKKKEGVDVRIIYDDFGCMSKVHSKFYLKLRNYGFKCFVFNRYLPIVNIKMNNRDHRKIIVIDGHTSYTGGINLSDEYVNVKPRFGVWKDNFMRLKGPATYGLTTLFLANYTLITKENINPDEYRYELYQDELDKIIPSGYVQPFGDVPYDFESISGSLYLNMIYKSNRTLYISTPYFIIDSATKEALISAARRGVDVRIYIPGIPDKKLVYESTLGNLKYLIYAGVKVYRYTPGFNHCKMIMADDKFAVVGTINFDLRSLFLNMENGVFLYDCEAIKDIKKDFNEFFEASSLIAPNEIYKTKWYKKIIRAILSLFAPMF